MSIATPDAMLAGLLSEDSAAPIQVISLMGPVAEAPLWVITKLAPDRVAMLLYLLLQLGDYGVDTSNEAIARRIGCTADEVGDAFESLVGVGALRRLSTHRLELVLENPEVVARLREVERRA